MTVINVKDELSKKETISVRKLKKTSLSHQNFKEKDKIFETISANDSSRACLLPNGNLTVSTSYDYFEKNSATERFKCMIPFKYENDYMFNFSKRIFVRNEIDSSKYYLTDIMHLDPSDEDIKNDSNKLISKHISKILVGWDKQGIHYWLSKINKSKKKCKEIDIPSDSWLHIHVCEKCLEHLNLQCNLCRSATMYLPEEMKFLSCSTGTLYSCGEPLSFLPSVLTNDSDGTDVESSYSSNKCSEQYFRRVVYCNNACALNFKFPEEHFSRHCSKHKCPNLNPYMRVVVYGTDPCGLNFPVDLENVELNDLSNKAFSKPVENKKDRSVYDSCNEFFSRESGDMEVNSDMFCRSEGKEMFLNELVSPKPFHYDHGDSSNCNDSKTCSLTSTNILSGSDSAVNNSTVSPSNWDDVNEKKIFNVNTTLFKGTTRIKKSDSYFTSRSLTSTDVTDRYDYEVISPHSCKVPGSNPLSSTIDSGSLYLFPKNTTRRKKIYHASYPQSGKLLEFSVQGKSKKTSFKRKPRSLCLRSGRRQIKKRRIAPLFLHFPDSSAMKVRMITIGRHYNRIFVQRGIDQNSVKSTTIKIENIPFILQVFCYLFFFFVVLMAFILLEDIWSHLRFAPPPPKYDWYSHY